MPNLCITVGEEIPVPKGVDPDVTNALLQQRLAELLDETITRYPGKEPGAWWLPARLGGRAPTPEEALAIEARRRESKPE